MAFIRRNVKDMIAQYPNRYKVDGVSKTIEPDFGTVTEAGTPINKDYLQAIEDFLDATQIKTQDALVYAKGAVSKNSLVKKFTAATDWMSSGSYSGIVCMVIDKLRLLTFSYSASGGTVTLSSINPVNFSLSTIQTINTGFTAGSNTTALNGFNMLFAGGKGVLLVYKNDRTYHRARYVRYNPDTDNLSITPEVVTGAMSSSYDNHPTLPTPSSFVKNKAGSMFYYGIESVSSSYNGYIQRFTLDPINMTLTNSLVNSYSVASNNRYFEFPSNATLDDNNRVLMTSKFGDASNSTRLVYFPTSGSISLGTVISDVTANSVFDTGDNYLFAINYGGQDGLGVYQKNVTTWTMIKHLVGLPTMAATTVQLLYNRILKQVSTGVSTFMAYEYSGKDLDFAINTVEVTNGGVYLYTGNILPSYGDFIIVYYNITSQYRLGMVIPKASLVGATSTMTDASGVADKNLASGEMATLPLFTV